MLGCWTDGFVGEVGMMEEGGGGSWFHAGEHCIDSDMALAVFWVMDSSILGKSATMHFGYLSSRNFLILSFHWHHPLSCPNTLLSWAVIKV